MAILYSKEEKNSMKELNNACRAVIDLTWKESKNPHLMRQRMDRLLSAQKKFEQIFNL